MAGLKAHTRKGGERCTAWNLIGVVVAISILGVLAGGYFKSYFLGVSNRLISQPKSQPTLHFPHAGKLPADPASFDAIHPAASTTAGKVVEAHWSAPWTSVLVCDDSCPSSKDGHCGDGRSRDGKDVVCDLGTDCSDCGSWTFQVPEAGHQIPKPVQQLRSQNVSLRVIKVATSLPFLMPFTDHENDTGLSLQLHQSGVYELGATQMWLELLQGGCGQPEGRPALVLDVGANFGWYSLLAAAAGCRVVAWEPVPLFRSFLQYGLQLNNFSRQVSVREAMVDDSPGETHNLSYPLRGDWASAALDFEFAPKDAPEKQVVAALSERIDDVVAEDVLLLKVDASGFEPPALQSAKRLLDKRRVQHLFMEYNPGVYEGLKLWGRLHELPEALLDLVDSGYTLLHLNESSAQGFTLPEIGYYEGLLPALQEVSRRNLEYDLEDTQKMQEGSMGCYAPDEMVDLNPIWTACNRVPEELSPKSFRSTFASNTTVWAVADPTGLQMEPPVGIKGLDQPETEWTGRDPAVGMGGRSCADLSPQQLVIHRCPCTVPECRKEAFAALAYAKQGKMGKLENRG